MSSSGTSSRIILVSQSAPSQTQDAVSVRHSNVPYVTQRSLLGIEEWRLVCLTIRAFNHITSISASSHTDLNAFMLWKPTWKNYLSYKSKSGVEMDKQSFTKMLCII